MIIHENAGVTRVVFVANDDVDEPEGCVHTLPSILHFVGMGRIFDGELTRNFLTFFLHPAQLLISKPE